MSRLLPLLIPLLLLCGAAGCSASAPAAPDDGALDRLVQPEDDAAPAIDRGSMDASIDAGSNDVAPYPSDEFCRSWLHCGSGEVCDFALGRCERRDDEPASGYCQLNKTEVRLRD